MGAYGGVSWTGRLAARWGHYGSSVLVAAIAAAIALGVYPPPAGSSIALLLPVALFAVVIFSWLLMRDHDRRLCEFCVSSMPLEAAEIASQLHRRFTLAHLGERRQLVVGYLIVLIGANGLLLIGPAGRVGWAVVESSMIYLVLAYSSHRRFQPWCPQCRGGDIKQLVA
jgi:hypothetical protein